MLGFIKIVIIGSLIVGAFPGAIAAHFLTEAGHKVCDVLWCFMISLVLTQLGVLLHHVVYGGYWYTEKFKAEPREFWGVNIVLSVLLVLLYYNFGLPSKWVRWCPVILLSICAALFLIDGFIQTGLFLGALAAALWFVCLKLAFFDPAPVVNASAQQSIVRQQEVLTKP